MRTAIYARYSTDRQEASSIDDQMRVCRERAAADGWTVARVFEDREISGAVTDRPGYQALLEHARSGAVQVILVEEVSRLWRAQAEQWRCVEELEFIGVRVVGVRDGIDTSRDGYDLLLAVQGAMNARQRRETAWRTHRGLTGRVERGLFAGGTPYGYRTEEAEGGRRLVIDGDHAQWVRWIFEAFRDGMGCKAIAHELNRRHVPAPRGGSWSVSAIYGHQGKGTGILNNELYRGRYIWNRSKWVQIPGTKKRKRVERPETEWSRQDMPEIRIIEDELWQAVKARQRARRHAGGTAGRGRPALTLLAGVMACGECGGPIIAVNAKRYGCANHQQRGTAICGQGLGVSREQAEAALIALARDDIAELSSPAAMTEMQRLVRQELAAARDEQQASTAGARRRIAELDTEIRNLTDAVARAPWSEAIGQRLQSAEAERRSLQADIDDAPMLSVPELVPGLLDRYRALLADLGAVLKETPAEARDALKSVLGPVRLVRDGGQLVAELSPPGKALMRLALGSPSLNLVAGACFSNCRRIILRAA